MANFEDDDQTSGVNPERWRRYTPNHPREDNREKPPVGTIQEVRPENQELPEETETRGEAMLRQKKEEIEEQERIVRSLRGIVVETINVLYREYDIRSLKFLRLRIEDAQTVEELKVAADMILTIGRFHECAGGAISQRGQTHG